VDSTARETGEASSEARRKPKEVSVEEYLWAAETCGGFKEMARFLNLAYSSMMDHLERRDLHAHCYNLFGENTGKPGKRGKPPLPTIEGAGPHGEIDVEAIKESAIRLHDAKRKRAKEKADQHIRFQHGPVAIIFLGDQHIGNGGTDYPRMYEEQLTILQTPGAYVWQMGDLIDNFIIGKLQAENMKPSSPIWHQWAMGGDYLRGFAERLLAVCGGNHEAWTLRLVGIDFTKEVVPGPGVLYDADEIRATIHVGEHEVKVWSRHKWRGGSIYNQTHGQERAARFDTANYDVFVGAHSHTGAVSREFILNASRKIAVQTGSYKVVDDYARVVGFPAHDASTACALVINDSGSMFACADLLAVKEFMSATYKAA
jgi:hypothetical protein